MRCWGPLSCTSWVRTSASTRPRMTTPEHISPESAKFLSSEQCCAHWLTSGLFRHVYNRTCEEGLILASETFRLSMRRYRGNRGWSLGTKSPDLTPMQVLFCGWRGTYSLPKAFSSWNVTFKFITLISCDIQRSCISSFENLQLIHVFCVNRGNTL